MAELFEILGRPKRYGLIVAGLLSIPVGIAVDWIAWRRLGGSREAP